MILWFVWVDIQREEKIVQKSIKEAAKRNDMQSAKVDLLSWVLLAVVSCEMMFNMI